MTLNQLQILTEDEVEMCLYFVNVIAHSGVPKTEFKPRDLTWFNRDLLIKKLLDNFASLNQEGHSVYVSLMHKLGVKIEIKVEQPPKTSTETSTENTSSLSQSNDVVGETAEKTSTESVPFTGSL